MPHLQFELNLTPEREEKAAFADVIRDHLLYISTAESIAEMDFSNINRDRDFMVFLSRKLTFDSTSEHARYRSVGRGLMFVFQVIDTKHISD